MLVNADIRPNVTLEEVEKHETNIYTYPGLS